MSPTALPGDPIEPPKSDRIIKCPNCSQEYSGLMVVALLELRAIRDIAYTCENCGYIINLKQRYRE